MNSRQNTSNTNRTNETTATFPRTTFLYSQPDNTVLYDTELCKTAYQFNNIIVDMSNKRTHQVYVEVGTLAVNYSAYRG